MEDFPAGTNASMQIHKHIKIHYKARIIIQMLHMELQNIANINEYVMLEFSSELSNCFRHINR